jgi:CubicO group peptidase (beta-lactamase class C family)
MDILDSANDPNELPRSMPEAQGISSGAILDFLDAVRNSDIELHSLMLLRHGVVVAEGWWNPYVRTSRHMLYSLSKSFTSSAAGFAVAEGHFTLDDPILPYFPDEQPTEISENLRAMRVRDLLTMATGHTQEPILWKAPDGNWARQFLATPVEKEPGTHFLYNSAATYMVSALIEKTTGEGLLAYLTPRLLEPLGITKAVWETDPRGIAVGGWGLNIKTEDIARFGQFYLQKGVWNGKRLLASEWIEQATAKQIENGNDAENDWHQGYGFQFWRSRHGAYRGDGAFGQFCVVLPEQDAVIAITSGTGNMGGVLRLIWEHLLPAMQTDSRSANRQDAQKLADRLSSLEIALPSGATTSPIAATVSGKTYYFAENELGIEKVTVDLGGDTCVVTLYDADGAHRILSGLGHWEHSKTRFLQTNIWRSVENPIGEMAVNAIWTDDRTLVLKLCFYETPFTPTLTIRFDKYQMTLHLRGSVGFGPSERSPLTGTHA